MVASSENEHAGPTPDQVEALLEAARYDEIEDIVGLFSIGVPLDSKDSQGRTALHMAAANGHLAIVDYLIKNGADVNATNLEKNTPLHWACLNGHTWSHERTPVDEAVCKGKLEVVDAINAAVAQAELEGVTVS
ncbi:ankyrin repeat domain-containing protein 2-like protein [Carex littledalei]|uniref:Ankyrin repeat domain-containing protein 2-like protein n=1 Tax=Carex littledalei TaxID=544730 RepID=A0A833QW94_9POAL|nr:ankyrin repeat domain-containing protein 2-like protein [Carex littledalei]